MNIVVSPRIATIVTWLAGPLLFGLLSLLLGQDANWDLRNYHFYNAYAFLNQRLHFDVAPAQVANFYNPLLHVPFYYLVTGLPPMAVGFLLGAVQGLNYPLLIGIARSVLGEKKNVPWWLYHLIALLGVVGAGNISEVGTVFADNLISLPVLGGVWLLLANYRILIADDIPKGLLLASAGGLLFGIAAGLKQPAAVFALGWCAAFLVVPVPFWRRIGLAFSFGLGVLLGIAASGGFWMYELWTSYGNPLFPYFNQFFASPMASLAAYRDIRFLPGTLRDVLAFPFLIALDPMRAGEIAFRDLRFVVFFALLVVFGLLAPYRHSGGGTGAVEDSAALDVPQRRKGLFLLCGGLVAYAAWMRMFAIYRYLLPLEMLAPLGIWLLITAFPWQRMTKYWLALGCTVLLLVTLQPGNWGRVSWGDDYFGVYPPPLADPYNTMVLMTGFTPFAYVIPFFPAPVRFLRIHSYFTGPSDTPNGSDLLMQQMVAGHGGPLYVLYSSYEPETAVSALQAYGLQINTGDCRTLKSRIEEGLDSSLLFCAVAHIDSSNIIGENK